jgi:serine/threonine-protein kinase HipA
MAHTDKRLAVFARLGDEWTPAGLLDMTEQGNELVASSFTYGLQYARRPDAVEVDPVTLSLNAALAAPGAPMFPATLEPPVSGGIRDAAPDAWGRRLIEARLRVPANSLPESTYLLNAGRQRVGALDIRTDRNDLPDDGDGESVSRLDYLVEAAERVEEGLPIPVRLEAIFNQGSGLGGARPKATVRDEDGVLWLAKFPSRGDRMSITEIEAATLRLAAECGFRVPPVRIVAVGARQIMLIRRFDRYWYQPAFDSTPGDAGLYLAPHHAAKERRVPFVSALTLVGCSEHDAPQKSYHDIAAAVRRYVHVDAIRADNAELFRRMVFNILVSNNDDHLRNHGFIRDPRPGGWRLSPLYDVLPMPSLAYERFQAIGVGPQGKSATLDNAMQGHQHFTLSPADARREIEQVWKVVREWRVYFEQYNVPAREIEAVAPAFRHIDDVASPALRKQIWG